MRLFILPALLAISLSACSEQGPVKSTPEETFISQMFAMLNTGTAYDEICNNAAYLNARNANLVGNFQTLAGELGAVMRKARPDLPEASIENRVKYQGNYALTRAKEVLNNKGCDNPEAQQFAKALQLYVSTPPAQTLALIEKEMARSGITRAR